MKAPGLLEAMRFRVLLDPGYAGAAEGWSTGAEGDRGQALERDMDFLHLRDRARAELRQVAGLRRDLIAQWHALAATTPELAANNGGGRERADRELAMTVAWVCDREQVRSLLLAEAWWQEALSSDVEKPVGWLQRATGRVLARFRTHPVDLLCDRIGQQGSASLRSRLRHAFRQDPEVRRRIVAWLALPIGVSPRAAALDRLARIACEGAALRTELGVLRAIQSLSILDVRNYREIVFDLGGYAHDGEDPQLATRLP
jgi:hypothetical protein